MITPLQTTFSGGGPVRSTVTTLSTVPAGSGGPKLRGLRFSGAAQPGASLVLGEKEVGTVGSAALSPALGSIGLAILRREAEPGATVAVGEDGVTAEVVALPFG